MAGRSQAWTERSCIFITVWISILSVNIFLTHAQDSNPPAADAKLPPQCSPQDNSMCQGNSACEDKLDGQGYICHCVAGFEFDETSGECEGTSTEYFLYMSMVLNATFTPEMKDESSPEFQYLANSMGQAAYGTAIQIFPSGTFIRPELVSVSEYFVDGYSHVLFNASFVFSVPVTDDFIHTLAVMMLFSHQRVGGRFMGTEYTFLEGLNIFKNRTDMEKGISALDWCSFFNDIGYPWCGIDECHPHHAFVYCQPRTCSQNTGFSFKTLDCQACESPQFSQQGEPFCFQQSPAPQPVNMRVTIDFSTKSCDRPLSSTADDYIKGALYYIRILISSINGVTSSSRVCLLPLCGNMKLDIEHDDNNKIVCRPDPSCQSLNEGECQKYRVRYIISIYNTPNLILGDNGFLRKTEDLVLQALYLMAEHFPPEVRRELVISEEHFIVRESIITKTPADFSNSSLYLTVFLNVPFTNELLQRSSFEFIDLEQRFSRGADEIFSAFVSDYLTLDRSETNFLEFDYGGRSLVQVDTRLLFTSQISPFTIFGTSYGAVYSFESELRTFGSSGFSLVHEVYVFSSLADKQSGNTATEWCSLFNIISFDVCGGSPCVETEKFFTCPPLRICDQGYYLAGTNCLPCGTGLTTPFKGATQSDQCIALCGLNEGFSFSSLNCESCTRQELSSTDEEMFCYFDSESDMTVDFVLSVPVGLNSCDFTAQISASEYIYFATLFVRSLLGYRNDDYIFDGICVPDEHCENVRVTVRRDTVDNDKVWCGFHPKCSQIGCSDLALYFTIHVYGTREDVQVLRSDTKRRSISEAVKEALFFALEHSPISSRRTLVANNSTFYVEDAEINSTALSPEDIESRKVYVSLVLNIPFVASMQDSSSQEFISLHDRIRRAAGETLFYSIPNFSYLYMEVPTIGQYHVDGGSRVLARLNTSIVLSTAKTHDILYVIAATFLQSHNLARNIPFGSSGITFRETLVISRNKEDFDMGKSAVSWCLLFTALEQNVCHIEETRCQDDDVFFLCVPSACEKNFYQDGISCKQCPNNMKTLFTGATSEDDCVVKCGSNLGLAFAAAVPYCRTCLPPWISFEDNQFCILGEEQEMAFANIHLLLNFHIGKCFFVISNERDENGQLEDPSLGPTHFMRDLYMHRYRGICNKDNCSNVFVTVMKDQDGHYICQKSDSCAGLTDDECYDFRVTFELKAFNVLNQITSNEEGGIRDPLDVIQQSVRYLRPPPNREHEPAMFRPKALYPFLDIQYEPFDYSEYYSRRLRLIIIFDLLYDEEFLKVPDHMMEFVNQFTQSILNLQASLAITYFEFIGFEPFEDTSGYKFTSMQGVLNFQHSYSDYEAAVVAFWLKESHVDSGASVFAHSSLKPLIGPVVIYRFDDDGNIPFTECPEYTWETTCDQLCMCVKANAEYCSKSESTCICADDWPMVSCGDDINECNLSGEDAATCPDNSVCQNKPGGYDCHCDYGYNKTNNDLCIDIDECSNIATNDCAQDCTNTEGGYTCSCRTGFEVDPINPSRCYKAIDVNFQMILLIDVTGVDFSDVNNEGYQRLFNNTYVAIFILFEEKVVGFQTLTINSLRQGSLIVDATAVVNEDENDQAAVSAGIALQDAVETGINIDNTIIDASVQLDNNVQITAQSSKCDLREAVSPCETGFVCSVEDNGKALCKVVPDDDDDKESIVLIAMAIGCPLLFIIVAVTIGICFNRKKKCSESTRNEQNADYSYTGKENDAYVKI